MARRIAIFLLLVLPLYAALPRAALAKMQVKVDIKGVGGDVKKNVLSFLGLGKFSKSPGLNDDLVKTLYGKAPGEIREALQPYGFYTPKINGRLFKKDGNWHAVFVIDPGQPVRISEVDLRITGEGANQPPFENFTKTFPLRQGDVLNEQAYDKAKQNLLETASNSGFLNAAMLRHQILVYPQRHEAQVFLYFDTGPQFKFGDVTFIQSKKILSNRLLQRYIPFKKGDPFNATVLVSFQDALTSSQYFSMVQVAPEVKKAAGLYVPIVATLTPAKRYQISVGGGYGTDTGLRGRIDWQDRWVNRKGHHMEVDLRLSQLIQNAVWRYIVPLGHPLSDHLDYTTGYVHENNNIWTSQSYFGQVSYTRAISVHWLQTLYFRVERVYFTVADESATDKLFLPGATWTYKKAPASLYSKEGIRLIFNVRGTAKAMLSSVSFIQGRISPKYVRGIGGFGSLILRGDIGATAVNNFLRLPASYRYFTGGDTSIRGYSYKTLGTKNAQGQVEGGKYLLVASAEYAQKIYGKWGLAFFYDGGNAFSQFPPVWKSGAGTGIRWASPVGPVRVDFAWALEPGHTFHVYVSIGPEI